MQTPAYLSSGVQTTHGGDAAPSTSPGAGPGLGQLLPQPATDPHLHRQPHVGPQAAAGTGVPAARAGGGGLLLRAGLRRGAPAAGQARAAETVFARQEHGVLEGAPAQRARRQLLQTLHQPRPQLGSLHGRPESRSRRRPCRHRCSRRPARAAGSVGAPRLCFSRINVPGRLCCPPRLGLLLPDLSNAEHPTSAGFIGREEAPAAGKHQPLRNPSSGSPASRRRKGEVAGKDTRVLIWGRWAQRGCSGGHGRLGGEGCPLSSHLTPPTHHSHPVRIHLALGRWHAGDPGAQARFWHCVPTSPGYESRQVSGTPTQGAGNTDPELPGFGRRLSIVLGLSFQELLSCPSSCLAY